MNNSNKQMMTPADQAFHSAAGTHKAGMYNQAISYRKPKAPTPFQLIGGGLKSIGRAANKTLTKVATKITAPIVRERKYKEAQAKEYSRKARAGELN